MLTINIKNFVTPELCNALCIIASPDLQDTNILITTKEPLQIIVILLPTAN